MGGEKKGEMAIQLKEKKPWISKELTNIFLLGIGFMFSMGSYSTCAMSQTVILNSVQDEYFEGTSTIGYTVLCAVYGSTAISFLLAPSVAALLGPKIAMVTGAFSLLLYVLSFVRPLVPTLFLGAAFQGLGQGLIWTVYGLILSTNSTDATIGRNTGIFWCLFQSSLVFGNLFYFFMLRGLTTIPVNTRITIFVILIISAAVGMIVLSFLRHPWTPSGSRRFLEGHRLRTMSKTSALETSTQGGLKHLGPIEILGSMGKLACSRNMIMLLPVFIYSGLDLCFYVSVLGTSIGYTEEFGDLREALVGLNGVFVGVGQIVGGMLFASLGKCAQKHGRDPALVLGGMLSHLLAYYLVYVSLPANAPLMVTRDPTFIKPNPYIAMFCAALLGFGDAAWINQLCALLGTLFLKDAIVAFAYFQFIQCLMCSAAFFYTPYLTLPHQVLINVIGLIAGVFGFCMVEWNAASETQMKARIQSIRDKAENEALLRIVKPKNGHQTEIPLLERITEKQ